MYLAHEVERYKGMYDHIVTIFRSISMLCGTDIIPQNVGSIWERIMKYWQSH